MIGYVNFYTPTSSPTAAPVTVNPTAFPTLPTTSVPTASPVTVFPTSSPSTALPTTGSPTASPVTVVPTRAPLTQVPTLPTTATPSFTPSAAPTMPPTLIHLVFSWSGYSSSSGSCTFNSGGVVQYMIAGSSMSWKNCIYTASEYGAMLYGSQYTGWGWGAHRLNSVAEYVTSWPTYATRSISSLGTCVLARDPLAGSVNNRIPANSILYENDIWYYQDMGSMFYDQCQTTAGLYGASIITPV